jgi:cytochrome c biogenesis protein CcmG/thiol:disulfide interchange protein DsbE
MSFNTLFIKRLLLTISMAMGLLGPFLSGPVMAIQEGAAAPGYDIKLMNGAYFSPAENVGKVVVMHFWATWCIPCREEMPALDRYYRKHHAEGLEMVAISMDDPADASKARDMMKAYAFQGAFVADAQVKGYGRIWRIPLSFVIDGQGILRRDGWYGDAGLDDAALEKNITPYLTHTANLSAPSVSLMVHGAYARATVSGQAVGAVYLTVINHGDSADRLVSASTSAAQAVQFHSMSQENNVSRMRQESGFDIPTQGELNLKPGGQHLMLVGLKGALKAGDQLTLKLTFAKGGEREVKVPIQALDAGEAPMEHMHHHDGM